jgi:fatty-acyl-CoA synthase
MVIPGEFFEPDQVMQTVEAEKCTALYGVPTMFIAELTHPSFSNYNYSTLRTGIMAGSPCPIETMKQVQTKMNMHEVTVCYGMTETSPVSAQSECNDPLDKRVSTVGTVHPHVEVKIVDAATGLIVPRGQSGEICTRGYSVMIGYWDMPQETDKVIDQNNWMHTGDLGIMDAEGYVKIVGRIKDTIIRGGENIAPLEIEDFLMSHEAVANAQVIGVPSVKYGEEVMAWVKLREGYEVATDELHEYCKGQIATFKIPKYWKFVDDFPMTVSGKVRKIEMREISIKELNLEDAAKILTA